MTIVDLIFIWFYIVNGVTVVTCGIASSLSENIFYLSNSILKDDDLYNNSFLISFI